MRYVYALCVLALATLAAPSSSFAMPDPDQREACTSEAKICPDGSIVGRNGPHCSWEPCPNLAEKSPCCTPYDKEPKAPIHMPYDKEPKAPIHMPYNDGMPRKPLCDMPCFSKGL
jgi:hypothetical protein